MTTKAQEKALEAKRAAKVEQVGKSVTNAQRRAIRRYFDMPLDELDEGDSLVVIAWLLDQSKTLDEYDNTPVTDLEPMLKGILEA